MHPNCPTYKQKLEELKSLHNQFQEELEVFKSSRDSGNIWETRKKIEELVECFEEEIFTISEVKAKEILGEKDVLGPEEIEKAFGIEIKPEDIPKILFKKEDLERAKALGQFLILRVNKDRAGNPLTMARTKEMLVEEFAREEKGKITMGDSYSKEFWEDDPIEMKWALVNKEVIPDSTSKNYLQQTEELIKYLQDKVFKYLPMPEEYQEAIKEFEDYAKIKFSGKTKEEIGKLLGGSDWKKYAQELAELKINKISRHTPAEFLYDILAYFQNNEERLFENRYTWTRRRDSDGRLVGVGYFGSDGADVGSYAPGSSDDDLGVSFSRHA